jgi:glycosyl transferase family 11
MSFVYIKLPKTGLGNMLLVWARGLVFATENEVECITSSWWGFRWGALLRREKQKRVYWNYFKETPVIRHLVAGYLLKKYDVIQEPSLIKTGDWKDEGKTVYLFNKIITEPNIFDSLKDHREYIKMELLNNLHSSKKKLLKKYERPVIGIHIRRGDFKLGSTITPIEYFIDGIKRIREYANEELSVTIFTDALPEEIAPVLALPNVVAAENKPDIIDLLLLSQSKIMILSSTSTFGYWAAFLSDAIVLRHPTDWLNKIRTTSETSSYTEIQWDINDTVANVLLKEKIDALKSAGQL